MNVFVWHDLAPLPGWQQMAIDEALLGDVANSGATVLRLYRWEVDTVSFGAHEAARRSWSRERLEGANVPVVRRPTGGRAVWHDRADLTYAVACPTPPRIAIRQLYRDIHASLLAALRRLNLAGTMAGDRARTPRPTSGACFDLAVGGEVLVDGRKTIGSAQLVRGGTLLQHGTIARSDNSSKLAPYASTSAESAAGEAHIVLPDAEQLAAAIGNIWVEQGAIAAPPELASRVTADSRHLAARYRDADWNWRR